MRVRCQLQGNHLIDGSGAKSKVLSATCNSLGEEVLGSTMILKRVETISSFLRKWLWG